MYLDFYHLKKAPFHITPDPEFLFLSTGHKAALGALVYGIEERQGFVALIGEVGLGKTTILRSYLERVDQSQLKPIYIFNSNVSFSELLKTLVPRIRHRGADRGYRRHGQSPASSLDRGV
jgi:general secretion pathway protein A